MKKTKITTIMGASIAAVLLFSIGFMQVAQAGVSQGTLTINAGCALTVPNQDMDFGTADAGDQVTGFFDVRNTGNEEASASVDDTATNGAWVDGDGTAIIDAVNTEVSDDNLATSTTLDNAPIAINNIVPDHLGANVGDNDQRVDLRTTVNLNQAFSGALSLDIVLVNNGCV